MNNKLYAGFLSGAMLLAFTSVSSAAVIDFAGGTAYLTDGSIVTTTNTGLWDDVVDYYIEDGIRVDFVGGAGTIGDYYNNSPNGGIGGYGNSVIHAHPINTMSIVFSKVDGTAFDLNYVDLTSNTIDGGGPSNGAEESYITTSGGYSLLLESSDWGIDYDFSGNDGDGIVRNWMDHNFDGITSFTITSTNAFCFGMDNFYIDEVAPVPVPAAVWLFGSGMLGLFGVSKRKKRAC